MSAVIEEKTIRGLREIAFLGFFTVALFFFIALITFSNEDAGWTHSGSMQSIANGCGVLFASASSGNILPTKSIYPDTIKPIIIRPISIKRIVS